MPEKTTTNPDPPVASRRASAGPGIDVPAIAGRCSSASASRSRPSRPTPTNRPLPGETPAKRRSGCPRPRRAALRQRMPTALIIGSDQVADCGRQGRSASRATASSARAMLACLSGKTVVFHTGIALLDAASGRCATATGRRPKHLSPRFRLPRSTPISTASSPYDCAGAVKSEGLGIALFEAIESDDPTALIGLPLITLTSMLRDAGVPVLAPAIERPRLRVDGGHALSRPQPAGPRPAGARASGEDDRHRPAPRPFHR